MKDDAVDRNSAQQDDCEDASGAISASTQSLVESRGNTQIGTLRKIYGPEFAPGIGESLRLSDAAARLDSGSLAQLSEHHADGSLPRRIAIASTIT